MIFPAVRIGQSFILAVCTSARGCLSAFSILTGFMFLECFFGNKNHDVKVVDPVEESVSEGLDSFGCWCSDNRVLVEFEP